MLYKHSEGEMSRRMEREGYADVVRRARGVKGRTPKVSRTETPIATIVAILLRRAAEQRAQLPELRDLPRLRADCAGLHRFILRQSAEARMRRTAGAAA
jgi:hypothetical protein